MSFSFYFSEAAILTTHSVGENERMEKEKGNGTMRAHKNSKEKVHLFFFRKPALLLCLADSLLARYEGKLQAQLEFSQFSEQTSWHQNLLRLPTPCIFKSLMVLKACSARVKVSIQCIFIPQFY